MLWAMGAFLTLFYFFSQFNETKSDIRQQFNSSYDSMLTYIRQTNGMLRSIQFMTDSHMQKLKEQPNIFAGIADSSSSFYYALDPESDCNAMKEKNDLYLRSFQQLLYFWKDSIAAPQGLNQVFIVGIGNNCMVNFPIRTTMTDSESLKRIIYDNTHVYMNLKAQGLERNLYWVIPDAQLDTGQLYLMGPIYNNGVLIGLMGLERTIRLGQFNQRYERPIEVAILNQNNKPIIYSPTSENPVAAGMMTQLESPYFGFNDDYSKLILKRRLLPSTLSVVYAVPTSTILSEFYLSVTHGVILNICSAIIIFFMIVLLERKMLAPTERNAIRLEEHEQFNHKIVASAPVGIIIIIRVSDGGNILSNELAHDYFRLLNEKDKYRILTIIREKSSNYIDVVTTNNTHLQISFVSSRYQNEEVAICVFVDVSIRAQMEKSLQDVAEAAEQANHAKSMFLATVSHELRTPLYGIIGNIELLLSGQLPNKVNRLVKTMDNSSALLLQIISDILDFSKIESKQLKIEHKLFSCREIFSFVLSNYAPLIAKKQLSLYAFIESDVPDLLTNDAVRLQQVVSNILNNSIKFTESGFVMLSVWKNDDYLKIEIKDSGIGMTAPVLMQLFDPFFQVNGGTNMSNKGTGLGLAICEKLVSLMDGDIEVSSEFGLGSTFTVRVPLYSIQYLPLTIPDYRKTFNIAIMCRNLFLTNYLTRLLTHYQFKITIIDEDDPLEGYSLLLTDFTGDMTPDIAAEIPSELTHIIQLLSQYIGDARAINQQVWRHNTYQLDKLPRFIDGLVLENSGNEVDDDRLIKHDESLSKYTVLIVDDHPINRHLLTDQLSSIGFSTATAVDGLDALDYLDANRVDIVLSDVNMPNLDGYQLATRLRQQLFIQPIVALTANAMAEEKQRCIDAGMNDCLSKPTKMAELRQTLLKYIKR